MEIDFRNENESNSEKAATQKVWHVDWTHLMANSDASPQSDLASATAAAKNALPVIDIFGRDNRDKGSQSPHHSDFKPSASDSLKKALDAAIAETPLGDLISEVMKSSGKAGADRESSGSPIPSLGQSLANLLQKPSDGSSSPTLPVKPVQKFIAPYRGIPDENYHLKPLTLDR